MVKEDFTKKLKQLEKVNKRIPHRMASLAVNFSKERFRQKNWVDTKREPWEERQDQNARGSLMAQSGRLKRSIRKIRIGRNYAVIGTDVSYAQLHNDGGLIRKRVTVREHKRKVTVQSQKTNLRTRKTTRGRKRIAIGNTTVKEHTRQMNLKMPARPFIGQSAVLGRRIERQIVKDYQQALR